VTIYTRVYGNGVAKTYLTCLTRPNFGEAHLRAQCLRASMVPPLRDSQVMIKKINRTLFSFIQSWIRSKSHTTLRFIINRSVTSISTNETNRHQLWSSPGDPTFMFQNFYRCRMSSCYRSELFVVIFFFFCSSVSLLSVKFLVHAINMVSYFVLIDTVWVFDRTLPTWRGTVVERRSLAGELSLSCTWPAADGWPLMRVSHPL